MKLKFFTVAGRGQFPFDMLRYDQCWPVGSDDTVNLDAPETAEEYKKIRQVKLATFGNHTPARWSSFGWSATQLSDYPKDHPATSSQKEGVR